MSSSVLIEVGTVTQYAFLGKDTNMLAKKKKRQTRISKDRLYEPFLTHKSLGSMPGSQTKYYTEVQ